MLLTCELSSIAPALLGRWQTSRRLALAWEMLRQVLPQACITHRFPLMEASQAYALIDRNPEETIQVVFDHQSTLNL